MAFGQSLNAAIKTPQVARSQASLGPRQIRTGSCLYQPDGRLYWMFFIKRHPK